jgi:hypothetical protein
MTLMKGLSISVLWLQAIFFIAGTDIQIINAAAGFVPGFESIQSRRLVAFLTPYLVLPLSFIFSLLLYRSQNYFGAVLVPAIFVAAALVVGQIYRTLVPDPIQENFGSRPLPYPGFLVLPPEGVPSGFQERDHHYTKQEYSVHFTKMLNGTPLYLHIVESPVTIFVHNTSKLVMDFFYKDILGHVYTTHDDNTDTTTLNLIWLNPPKQRISIYLTQTPEDDYSPDDLVKILESMRLAEQKGE